MVDSAYRVLSLYEKEYPDDMRLRHALEAKQAWIDEPSDENVKKLTAARDAARVAADAAWVATWAVTGTARDAAGAAIPSVNTGVWGAAGDAEEKWQRKHLRKLIKKERRRAMSELSKVSPEIKTEKYRRRVYITLTGWAESFETETNEEAFNRAKEEFIKSFGEINDYTRGVIDNMLATATIELISPTERVRQPTSLQMSHYRRKE
jgi:hypothetical protein